VSCWGTATTSRWRVTRQLADRCLVVGDVFQNVEADRGVERAVDERERHREVRVDEGPGEAALRGDVQEHRVAFQAGGVEAPFAEVIDESAATTSRIEHRGSDDMVSSSQRRSGSSSPVSEFQPNSCAFWSE